jgi:PAS domain S-box-containing protein
MEPRASLAPAVLDSLPELIALVDRHGTIRAVNRAWRETAPAIDGRELLRGRVAVGTNYLEVCARAAAAGDETAAAARRGIEQVLAGEMPHLQLEYPSPEPGRSAWYLLSVTPVAGGPAGQEGVVVAHADVTARRLAEEELAASEEWQRLIFETSSDLISTHAFDSSFLFVSAACRTLLGYEPAELVGHRVFDLLHPEDIPAANTTHRRLQTSSDVETIVCRYRRKDGRFVWVEAIIHMLQRGRDAAVPFLCVSRDISLRREAERRQRTLRETLERAAAEWATTFDAIRSPILILAPNGRIVRANEAARELSGRSYHGVVGHSLAAVGEGEPWDEAAITVRRLLGGARTASSEARDEETGRCWQIEATLAPAAEHSSAKVILQLRDVTDVTRLQESLRRSEVMATLGAVVAGVAHEIGNPLFGMSATFDAFAGRFGDRPEYQRYMVPIRTELERIRELTQVLLSHARPPAPQLASTDLGQTVEEALSLCRPPARRRRVTIEAEIGGEWPPITVDREGLVLALKNVVDNAVEHAPPGTSVRVVARRASLEGGEWLQLRVEDSGQGFPAADLPHVFEPFFSRRPGGAGLGLAIVAQVVESHGGRVRAENRGGGGAVEILLPLALGGLA